MDEVAHNLEVVRNKIADAAKGREVTLVAVSKTMNTDKIAAAYEAGQRILGENRMQELQDKMDTLSNLDIDWHFIGKLQSNKVKYIDDRIKLIHSVDSLELLQHIENRVKTPIDVLLQINIGKELQKNGFLPEYFQKSVEKLRKFGTIRIIGVMCVPPRGQDPTEYFKRTYELFMKLGEANSPNVQMKYLSMGMSGDFETAIACGSNMVRVGSSIFGQRL